MDNENIVFETRRNYISFYMQKQYKLISVLRLAGLKYDYEQLNDKINKMDWKLLDQSLNKQILKEYIFVLDYNIIGIRNMSAKPRHLLVMHKLTPVLYFIEFRYIIASRFGIFVDLRKAFDTVVC